MEYQVLADGEFPGLQQISTRDTPAILQRNDVKDSFPLAKIWMNVR